MMTTFTLSRARLTRSVANACLVSILAMATTPAFAQNAQALSSSTSAGGAIDLDGKAIYDRILGTASQRLNGRALAPIVRIVSPLADSALAGGVSLPGKGSLNGTNFTVNVEVVTRDNAQIVVREATEAPPVFGIRHVDQLNLGHRNPDVPGLFVFFDQPLTTPDGTILPAFNNFAAAFNVAGTDDTPGVGHTTWLGWHVLESLPIKAKNVTLTVAIVDRAGRVAFDQIKLNVDRSRTSGQALTPAPETFTRTASTIDDGQGPEISLIAPRVPTAIAVGPTDNSLTPNNGSLFFIHLSAVDRSGAGIAVSENGLTSAGQPLNAAIPAGLIFDPSAIPNAQHAGGPNRNYPGMTVTFDVPLRQPSGNIVPAGTNLAGLFDVAGSEVDVPGAVRTTADWVVGGSLVMPAGKKTVTIDASVTDNAGHTGTTKNIVGVSPTTSGQELTANPSNTL